MCNCIEEINKALADKNTSIEVNWLDEAAKAIVSTVKIDTKKRGAPTCLFASYCPFCGCKYE